ncbi:hypothetical protein [Vagococcus salmoninarum]|uniref:hypothetical protein n=1 Tax=Vagococcus salmoninarum TaxID=2739 RepID=UPI003F9AD2C0
MKNSFEFSENNKILYSPIGDSRSNPLERTNKKNTLETLIDLRKLYDNTKNLSTKKCLDDKTKNIFGSYPVWGMNENKKKEIGDLKENDLVFFGYKNCILYIGVLWFDFNDTDLSWYLWNEDSWECKIILKKLIKVYIPRNAEAMENNLFLQHNIRNMQPVKKAVLEGLDFTNILGFDPEKKGNHQGNKSVPETDIFIVLDKLNDYFIRTEFNSIKKVII